MPPCRVGLQFVAYLCPCLRPCARQFGVREVRPAPFHNRASQHRRLAVEDRASLTAAAAAAATAAAAAAAATMTFLVLSFFL